MREYETIYIMKAEASEEVIKNLQTKAENLIRKAQGHVLCHVNWGKRKFAYAIEKMKQGQYFYFQYLSNGTELGDLDKVFKYDDNVLRALTVKLQDEVNVEERLATPVEAPEAPAEDFGEPAYERRGYRDRPRGYRDEMSSDEDMDMDLGGEEDSRQTAME